ncbi:MAG: hypothetical protein BWK76_19185 [Desulfobulbaceae bacterium A2]|nr:MAG: hypothetical protein BWK76_19185 [Desulfobulbaceae bacterium A2]
MINSIGNFQASTGSMSTQSATQRRDDLFSKVDSSSDGSIDTVEFSDMALKLSQMSGTEINAEEAFSSADADGDGALSAEELDTFMQENAPPPPEGVGGMPPGLPPGGDDLFEKLDSSGDGSVDTEEFAVFADKLSEDSGTSVETSSVFSKYDADGDGVLSAEELQAYLQDNPPPPPPEASGAQGYAGNSSTSTSSRFSTSA